MYWRKSRGTFLKRAIADVLNDHRLNKNYALLVYENPNIDLLRKTQKTLPSYIPAQNFASALIDVMSNESVAVSFNQNLENGEVTFFESNRDLHPMQRFILGVEQMKHSDLKILLRSFIDQAANNPNEFDASHDFNKLNAVIIAWYDGYMDRVNGWFKNAQKGKLFLIGLAVALALNVNSISLVKELSKNKQLTAKLVDKAITLAETQTQNEYKTQPANGKDSVVILKENIEKALEEIDVLDLPIGWEQDKTSGFSLQKFCSNNSFSLQTILGWFITAFALMLGAPFWFEIMNKLINIRSAGKNPVEKKLK